MIRHSQVILTLCFRTYVRKEILQEPSFKFVFIKDGLEKLVWLLGVTVMVDLESIS